MKQIIIFALLVVAATAQKTASKVESDPSRPSRGSRKFNTANVNDELGISSRSSFWNPDGDKQEKKVLSASERASLASQRRSHQPAKPRQTTQKVTDSEPVAASSVVAPVITQQHFLSRREKATRRSDSIVPEEDVEAQPTFPSRRRPTATDDAPRPDSSRRRPPAPVSENIADTPVPPRRVGSRRPSAPRSEPVEEELPPSRQRGGRRPSTRQRTEIRARPIPTEASAPAPLTTEAFLPSAAEAFEPLETVSREPVPPVAAELPQPDAAPVVTELSITETELVRATEVSSTTVKPTTQAQTPTPAQEDTESRYQGRRGGAGRNRGAQEAKTSRRLPQLTRSNVESADEVTSPPAAFSRTGRRNGPASTAAPQTDSKRRPNRPADAAAETPSEPKRRPFRPAPVAVENDVPPLTQEFKRRPTTRPVDNTEPNDVPPTLTDVRRRPSNRPAGSAEASQGVDVEPRRSATRTRPVSTTSDVRRGGRRSETPAETAEGAVVQRTSRKINADTSPRGSYKQSRRSGVNKLRPTSRPSVSRDDIDEDANYPPEFIKALKLTEDTKVKESSTKSSSQDTDETFVTKSSHTVSTVSILPQSLSEDSQGTGDTKNRNTNEDLVNKGDSRKRTRKYSRQNRPSTQPQNQENDSDHKIKRLNLLLAPSPPSENKEEESTKESNIMTLRDRYKPSGSYTLRGSKSIRGDDEKKQANKGESTTLSEQELPVTSSTPATRNPIASLQAKQGFRLKNLRFSKPKEETDKTITSTTESQVTQVKKSLRKSLFPSTTQSNFVSRKRFSSFKRSQESNSVTVKPTEYFESSTRSYKIRSTTSRTTSAFRRSAVATTEVITSDLLPATKLPLTPSSLLGSQKYSARFRSDLLLATGGLRSTSTPAYVPTVPLIRTSTTSETLSKENSSEALTLDLNSLTLTTTPQILPDGAKELDNNISTSLPSIESNLYSIDVMTDKSSLDQTSAFINLDEMTSIEPISALSTRNNSIKNISPNSSSPNDLSVLDTNNTVTEAATDVKIKHNASERFIDKIKPKLSNTLSSTTMKTNFENSTEIETKIKTPTSNQNNTMAPLSNVANDSNSREYDVLLTEVSVSSITTESNKASNNITSTVSPTTSKFIFPSVSTEYQTSAPLVKNLIYNNSNTPNNSVKSPEIKETTKVNSGSHANYSVVSLNFTLITPNNIKNHFISLRSNDSQILSSNASLPLVSRALISNNKNNKSNLQKIINKSKINSSTTVHPLTTLHTTKPDTNSSSKNEGLKNSQSLKGVSTYSPTSSDKLDIPLDNTSNKGSNTKENIHLKNNISLTSSSAQTSNSNFSINNENMLESILLKATSFQHQMSKLNNVTQLNSNSQQSQELTKKHISLELPNKNNNLVFSNAISKTSEQIPTQEILKTHSSEVKFVAIDRPPLESDSLIRENITTTSLATEAIRNSTYSTLITDFQNVSAGVVFSEKSNQLNLSDSTSKPEKETLSNSRFIMRLTVAPRTTFTSTTSIPFQEHYLYNDKAKQTSDQLRTQDRETVYERSKTQPELLETTTITPTPLPFVIFGIFPNNTVFRKYPNTGRIEQVNENEISRHQQYYPSETTSENQYTTSSTPDPIANEILYRNTIRNSIQTSLPQATVNTKPNVGQNTSENEVLQTLGSSSISSNQGLSQRSSMASSNEISSTTSQYTSSSTQPTTEEDVFVKANSSPATIVVQPEISNSVYIGKDSKYSNYWSSTTTEKSKFRYVTTNIFSSAFSTTVPSIVTPEQFTESTTKLIFRWKPVVPNVKSDTNEAEGAPTTGTITAVDSTSPVTITQSQLSPLPTTDSIKTSVVPMTQLVAGTTVSPILNITGQSISNETSSFKNFISKPTNLTNIPHSTNINVKHSETTQRPSTTTTKKTVAPSTVRVPVTTQQQYLIPTSTTSTPTFGIRSLISRVLGNGGINAASIQTKSKAPLESTTASTSQKEITNSLTKAKQNNKGESSSGQRVVELANKVIDHANQATRTSTQKTVILPTNYANTGVNDIVRDSKRIQIADQNEALASKVIEIAVQRATSTATPSFSTHHLTLDLLEQQSSNIKPDDVNDAIIVPSKTNTVVSATKTKPTLSKNQEDQLLAALLGNPLGTESQKTSSTRSRLSPEEQLLATLIRTQASATGSLQKPNKPVISKQEEQLLAALLNSPAKSSPKPISQVTTPKPKRLLSDQQILAGLLTGSTPSSPLDQARLVELLSGGRHRTKPTTTTTTAIPRGLGFLLGRFREPNLLSSSVLPSPNESIDPVSETNNDSVDGPRDTREQSNLVKAAIEVTKAVSQFMGAVIQGATRQFQSFFRSGTSLLSNYFAAGSAQAGPL